MAITTIFLIVLIVAAGILLIAAITLMAYNEHHRYGRVEADELRKAVEQQASMKENEAAVAHGQGGGDRE